MPLVDATSTLPPVSVVGLVGGEVFGAEAGLAIANADVVVGSGRQRAALAAGPHRLCSEPEMIDLAGPLDDVIDHIERRRSLGQRVCVLASGDPGFFGIVRVLARRLGPAALRIRPAPSSVALAFAQAGTNWDDATVISAHGRPLSLAVSAVRRSTKAAVLTDPVNSPQALGRALCEQGIARDVVLVSRIGEPDQRSVRTDVPGLAAGDFDPLSVVVLLSSEGAETGPSIAWGLPERAFAHRDGMITKAEVRAVVLGKLCLPATGVLWDVGAGSGSVGIEASAVVPALEVWAIERDSSDATRIEQNATDHQVDLRVVVGSAPDALVGLPDPDRVFIGGGGIDVLDACLDRLRPGGTVVATYVLLDRAIGAHARLGNLIQVRVDRCVALGTSGVRMEPMNPVFVAWGPM